MVQGLRPNPNFMLRETLNAAKYGVSSLVGSAARVDGCNHSIGTVVGLMWKMLTAWEMEW